MVSWGGLASASSSDAVGPIQSNSPITWGANHAYLHALPCSRLLIYWMSRELFRPYHQPPAQATQLHPGPTNFLYHQILTQAVLLAMSTMLAAIRIAAHWQPMSGSAIVTRNGAAAVRRDCISAGEARVLTARCCRPRQAP